MTGCKSRQALSGRIVRSVSTANLMGAGPVQLLSEYSDFREIERLVQLLAGLGWEVSGFESGREALAELGALNPDLILA